MRKEFDPQKESFGAFSVSLATGDTAILNEMGASGDWLGFISGLLRRGVVVRTPKQTRLDRELNRDTEIVEVVARLAVKMDRRVLSRSWSMAGKAKAFQAKKMRGVLEAKVHRLIEQEGMGVVEACRKVHCRPSAYYIYRSRVKLKQRA